MTKLESAILNVIEPIPMNGPVPWFQAPLSLGRRFRSARVVENVAAWRNGRRCGLKIVWGQPRVGSSPTAGNELLAIFCCRREPRVAESCIAHVGSHWRGVA